MLFRKLRNSSKILVIIVVIAFALGGTLYGVTSFLGGGQPTMPQQEQFRDVAGMLDPQDTFLTVNGEDVEYVEFLNLIREYLPYLQQFSVIEAVDFQNQVTEYLIQQVVMLQEAKERGIEVNITQAEVDEIIDGYLEDMGMTKEEFERNLRNVGDTLKAVESRVEHALWERQLIFALEDEVKGEVEITEEELIHAYEQARPQNIFVKFSEHGEEEALDRIQEAYDALQEGQDFAEVAAEYSDSPLGESKGGDMGMLKRDAHVHPMIIEKAFSLPVGEISEIFETDEGYHIVKVKDRIEAAGDLYEGTKADLEHELWQEKSQRYYRQWEKDIVLQADVTIHDPLLGGYYWYKQEDYDRSIAKLEEAMDKDPDNKAPYAILAQAMYAVGDEDKAVEISDRAIQQFPDDWELLYSYAELLQSLGNYEEAGKKLDQVVELEKDSYYTMLQTLRLLQGMGLEERVEKVEGIVHDLEVDLGYREPTVVDEEEDGRDEEEELQLEIDPPTN